jgi:methionine aminopeptidase
VPTKKRNTKLEAIRRAVADYMRSEGCGCCQNVEAHKKHEAALAGLLEVPSYRDGSGYDFARFRSKTSEDSP